MNAPETPSRSALFLAETHEVVNVARDLVDYNPYLADAALQEAVSRDGAGAAHESLAEFGRMIGTAEYIELGAVANRVAPELDTHDRFGNRVDFVRFHPAYHALMKTAIEHGLHSSPWTEPGPGAHVARAAHCYLHTQVEAGHGCPVTMTFAALPSLRTTPELARLWEPKITACIYDPRNVPDGEKRGVTIGMAMTEKQGGSDVRANTTRAYPIGPGGPGTPRR
jgi:putative acyl-CoA dehydrogenase